MLTGLFELWNIDGFFNIFMLAISGILSVVGVITLGVFWKKTRLSSLFGIFMGTLIPVISRLFASVELIEFDLT